MRPEGLHRWLLVGSATLAVDLAASLLPGLAHSPAQTRAAMVLWFAMQLAAVPWVASRAAWCGRAPSPRARTSHTAAALVQASLCFVVFGPWWSWTLAARLVAFTAMQLVAVPWTMARVSR